MQPYLSLSSHFFDAQYVQASQGGLRESDVEAVLKKIPIKAGAGKLKVMDNNLCLERALSFMVAVVFCEIGLTKILLADQLASLHR